MLLLALLQALVLAPTAAAAAAVRSPAMLVSLPLLVLPVLHVITSGCDS
jgi:hypothetical protein